MISGLKRAYGDTKIIVLWRLSGNNICFDGRNASKEMDYYNLWCRNRGINIMAVTNHFLGERVKGPTGIVFDKD